MHPILLGHYAGNLRDVYVRSMVQAAACTTRVLVACHCGILVFRRTSPCPRTEPLLQIAYSRPSSRPVFYSLTLAPSLGLFVREYTVACSIKESNTRRMAR